MQSVFTENLRFIDSFIILHKLQYTSRMSSSSAEIEHATNVARQEYMHGMHRTCVPVIPTNNSLHARCIFMHVHMHLPLLSQRLYKFMTAFLMFLTINFVSSFRFSTQRCCKEWQLLMAEKMNYDSNAMKSSLDTTAQFVVLYKVCVYIFFFFHEHN